MEEMNPSGEFVPEENDIYVPRPAWQVWAARVGLVIMLISIALRHARSSTSLRSQIQK